MAWQQALGLQLLQRDWLSANHIVFAAHGPAPATVVDTGYARHADLTLALVDRALAGAPLGRIVNTHLHSDHCGGNRALQARSELQTLIPAASFEAVSQWDESRLSYRPTGQYCERFRVDGVLRDGDTVRLGPAEWQVHAAPGHDPDALMLFEPQTRTLISGDALWEDRLAIIFPELEDQPGFEPAAQTLALIERLAPRRVIPGHGAAFEDLPAALAASRARLKAFAAEPARHLRHAARALVMFHMMEMRERERAGLTVWLQRTPLFAAMATRSGTPGGAAAWAHALLQGLLDDGLLTQVNERLRLPAAPSA
ncbi:MAG TPA: MBL fold metallo-hydrolase [Ideonella sp.]|uniref:MBL fold metallo-hydrolase n=1 Tax=Ideonella sp. TaxID=1929293 RepID=UPI002CD88FB9|nr:MBL fold metallo-hydrolase [Ideonella sp.]HSI49976.1 MBL fold metallo-hydrolase [Ideonella sp.]